MINLYGFDRTMFDVKRKRVNDKIKAVVRYGKLEGDEAKVKEAISIVEMYLGKYFAQCSSEEEALELVNKVTYLRTQHMKLRRHIASEAYAYATAK